MGHRNKTFNTDLYISKLYLWQITNQQKNVY